jgi:prostaglandin-endoperoxide synthase 2
MMISVMKAKKLWIYLAPRFPWLWWSIDKVPPLKRYVNRMFINLQSECTPARPYPFSLWGLQKDGPPVDYISWAGLSDRTYTGRHLPPAPDSYTNSLPDEKRVAALFRRDGAMTPCSKSSALFGFFAQWFTDSFLRTDPLDALKNTSNHEIDLCQIYGLTAHDTAILRSKEKGREGELASQWIGSQEYPPFIFEEGDDKKPQIKWEYKELSYAMDREPRISSLHLRRG